VIKDMTLLITGRTGVLGRELLKVFPDCLAPSHEELDLAERRAVFDYVQNHKLGTLIHTAALVGIRQCEENREKAWITNVLGTENLVDACVKFNKDIYFVYVSTACVFDGKQSMYKENDIPYPENFYALTKLMGEFVVKKLSNWLIVRTNFVGREKWKYSKAFTDRFGTYLFADDVARGIKEVTNEKMTGIVHIAGDKKMSMYELARITTKEVEPMTINEYSGPRLTMNMTLDSVRWKKYRISA
jgi:dTDP-4-dehydrorhamnose reductase